MTEVQERVMSPAEFVELVKELLLGEEGPKGAGLEFLTDDELHVLAAFFAERLFITHCTARDLGKREGRAEIENWRFALERKWPLWAGARGN